MPIFHSPPSWVHIHYSVYFFFVPMSTFECHIVAFHMMIPHKSCQSVLVFLNLWGIMCANMPCFEVGLRFWMMFLLAVWLMSGWVFLLAQMSHHPLLEGQLCTFAIISSSVGLTQTQPPRGWLGCEYCLDTMSLCTTLRSHNHMRKANSYFQK